MTPEDDDGSRRVPNAGRRRAMKGAFGLAALTAGPAVGSTTAVERRSGTASVTVEDQTTDGRSVVVSEVSTRVRGQFGVFDESGDRLYGAELEAGERVRDVEVPLYEPLTADQRLQVSVYNDDGDSVARDHAAVSLADDVSFVDGMDVTFVEADSEAGFNYPYYLYAPTATESEAGGPILVEPVNTGSPTDDFEVHREGAKELATGRQTGGRTISDRLGVPFLVPVIPRPRSNPVHYHTMPQMLDRDALALSDGKLERVDRQVLRMVDDAKQRLADVDYPVEDGIALNGFSATGNFVNRFAALHPDRVVSVTAGGTNGTPILPIAEAKGHTLTYPVGVADVAELTGNEFDLAAFRDVDQFIYMGALDGSDTVPYEGPWSDSQRQAVLDVFGQNMQRDRMPYAKSVYQDENVAAAFKIYDGVGHTPVPAMDDVVAFHRASFAGEDISAFGGNVGTGDGGEGAPPEIDLSVTPSSPSAGDSVEFDASATTVPTGQILSYTWDFDDGETAAGPNPTHEFTESGVYDVALTVVDDRGLDSHRLVEVIVSEAESTTATTTRQSTSGSATDAESETGGSPGFGLASAIAGVGGASYLLRRHTDDRQ